MLHIIFIKCKVDVMYFIFIFISPSVPRFSVKTSVNQLIKNKRPNHDWSNTEIFILKGNHHFKKTSEIYISVEYDFK